MIARIWHGTTVPTKSDEYLDYLNETGVSDYRATEGNRGVYVLRKIEDDRAHFLTVSFWESMKKIEKFAGFDPEKARYYPEDERFLLDFEPTVEHYEVVVEA
ncbi:MAG: antibiotic biosynthesis monooxygenase [Rubrobacter sp.]|jgi:heme-degrading monooxygenase HmoA|nr:antibiotic biosynthesis monooxygenase [Rubrobacter sp.]MBA3951170.1 antibiotic biosynthesis monooxygenase [Rubrobacter sp.]MDQ3361264.1 antibiotic biosynthesis monooxygenase [Actinomycetota bacterium]MDQ3376369.1 antibiotic biosynthesis monooxygenase [Actinomycetota bacterium]